MRESWPYVSRVAVDIDVVGELLRDVAAHVIVPRQHALRASDIAEKSPGELVTIVDREAEALLTTGLQSLLTEAPVVGEEASSADPKLLRALAAPRAWLVDPLDGTANFIKGSSDYAVMVALLAEGVTVASWILQPASGALYTAELGSGAYCNGERLVRAAAPSDVSHLRGAALTRFLSADQQRAVAEAGHTFGHLGRGRVCAGVDYPLIAQGEQDFVLFWRMLPWDHAPGALLLREAGGVVAHLDGQPYAPTSSRAGVIAAADAGTHSRSASALGLV